jgi:hypothetical protein
VTLAVIGVSALAVAALVAFAPKLELRPSEPMTPATRAAWVARLIALAEQAEKSGGTDVADAARVLVAALIAPKVPKQ